LRALSWTACPPIRASHGKNRAAKRATRRDNTASHRQHASSAWIARHRQPRIQDAEIAGKGGQMISPIEHACLSIAPHIATWQVDGQRTTAIVAASIIAGARPSDGEKSYGRKAKPAAFITALWMVGDDCAPRLQAGRNRISMPLYRAALGIGPAGWPRLLAVVASSGRCATQKPLIPPVSADASTLPPKCAKAQAPLRPYADGSPM